MTDQEYETRVTDWVPFAWKPFLPHGYTHYRIWQQRDGNRWFQRHEWKQVNGETVTENWIRGISAWVGGAKPVDEASPSQAA